MSGYGKADARDLGRPLRPLLPNPSRTPQVPLLIKSSEERIIRTPPSPSSSILDLASPPPFAYQFLISPLPFASRPGRACCIPRPSESTASLALLPSTVLRLTTCQSLPAAWLLTALQLSISFPSFNLSISSFTNGPWAECRSFPTSYPSDLSACSNST